MTFVPEHGVVTNSPLNPRLSPEELEVGRRNLLAQLRGFDGCDGEVSAGFVADYIAVLEASKPTVVDRDALLSLFEQQHVGASVPMALLPSYRGTLADRVLALLSPEETK